MKDHEIPAAKQPVSGKKAAGSEKQSSRPGGAATKRAMRRNGGGSKASKGPITSKDKHNPNSSQRS